MKNLKQYYFLLSKQSLDPSYILKYISKHDNYLESPSLNMIFSKLTANLLQIAWTQ